MLSLTSELDTQCSALFVQCDEFNSTQALRAVFVTTDLAPFADGLPESTGSKKTFVSLVKLYLLEKHLVDGRVLILPFLNTLRGRYPEQAALHGELDDLYRRILAHAQPAPLPPPLSLNHHFICYAPRDGAQHAQRLHAALKQAGALPWLDLLDTPPGHDHEAARQEALRECANLLLILTPASARIRSESAREWRRALGYKKPIIPLLFAPGAHFTPGADLPLMLGNRPVLDFTGPLAPAVDNLRQHLADLGSPAGQLHELEYRLADAERELRPDPDNPRILQDIERLEKEITVQRAIARDPEAAARAAKERNQAAMERERQPARPTAGRARTKFINPPPLVAPAYFQNRHVENHLIADFLRDPARRLLTVVGRGGVGKTAMVCRLLKSLESGHLPDDLGALPVSGIVYLSNVGSRRVSFPNLHAGLLRLLPAEQAQAMETLYKDPQKSVAAKLAPVWQTFAETAPTPVLVLFDNLEDLLDPDHAFTDVEIDAALRALLDAPPHPVQVLLTTRAAPREILLHHPQLQTTLHLDEGLESPYAEEVLRAGDPTGALGLKDAPDTRLAPACEFTRGYPRALEAITAALNADRSASLDDLLSEQTPDNVVQAMVGQAYSRLDPAAQKVMQALAVFGRPVPPAAADYLLQPHDPGLDTTPVLNRMVNMRFVTKESGRYYMHPVDRAYALQRLTLGPALNKLQSRAADYFRDTRTPRADWKTLADLAPQRAEIDLRYAAGDYDTAARVLRGIDFDYLLLWGHYLLMIEQHERLQGKLSGAWVKQGSIGNLGSAYYLTAQISKAIACYKQAVVLVQEAKDKWNEGVWLGNLGNCYADLGQTHRAIELYEQALVIDRETGYRRGEARNLSNLGDRYAELGQATIAVDYNKQALTIDIDIGNRYGQGCDFWSIACALVDAGNYTESIQYARNGAKIGEEINTPYIASFSNTYLSYAHLYSGDLPAARAAAEQARQYDVPQNNHNVFALLGVIARRQNDAPAAHQAFTAARAAAEELLAHTPEYFAALDTKALALAGLGEIADARAAYHAARAINSDPGIVQRTTRLLEQLDGEKFW